MLQRLGRFELMRRLGQGAMGEVYLARDPVIGREVALKTIRPEAALGGEARERFAREARAAGALNHPNLVTVHEFGEDQGLLYLAMEFVPGSDLEALLRDRVLAPVDVLELLAQVCDGLAYAHGRGVLHRDIKPSNIRVQRLGDRLHAKVMDFGIARLAGSDMTGTGTLMGTFGYMAPEYIRTGKAEPGCDLFAVGVILYEALAGHRPFEGDTTATVLYRLVNEEPAPLSASDLRGLSPQVAQLAARALAKEPHQRFACAEDLAVALRASRDPSWTGFAAALPTRKLDRRPPPTVPSARVAAPRIRPWTWVAVATLLAAGGVGTWALLRRPAAPRLISLPPPEPANATAPEPTVSAPAPPKPVVRGAARPAARLTEVEASELLNEASRSLVDQPGASLAQCDRVLRDDPMNARAYALKTVALYGLGRYQELPGVLEAGKAHGVRPGQYLAFVAFQAMLREERRDRRLPPEVREALAADLPFGARRVGVWNRRP